MYFSETANLREYERFMQEVPNFEPRGSKAVVLCKHEYTAEDCDCYYCQYHLGGRKKPRCRLEHCICIDERITAGATSVREVLTETMSGISNTEFRERLNKYIKESENNPMSYKNEKHRQIFEAAIADKNKRDYALVSAIYLMTADYKLWQTVKRYAVGNVIRFDKIHLKGTTENGYALFCAAKDLYYGTKHLSISDLADTNIIPNKVFALICNAMAIRRYGLGAIQFTKSRGDRK